MPVPPILDVFVLWHPRDRELGSRASNTLLRHFHGVTFSGLAGGAVEIYTRSEPWDGWSGPPRPLPFLTPLPYELPAAQMHAVIPVFGIGLARAVQEDETWRAYLEALARAAVDSQVSVYPLLDPQVERIGTLGHLFNQQALPASAADDPELFCREVCQALAQQAGSGAGDRTRIFVSHTKRQASKDAEDAGPRVYDQVRALLSGTRLDEFFDAHDLQTGSQWEAELDSAACSSALLMVRTDLYAGREWCQREVRIAKQHDLPVVALQVFTHGDQRGSFLMDHVPAIPWDAANPERGIGRALSRLVDEALKHALWKRQRVFLEAQGFDWLPAHAPEPATVARWLSDRLGSGTDRKLLVLHPDPPLGPDEHSVLADVFAAAGLGVGADVVTPRTFAARGGRLGS